MRRTFFGIAVVLALVAVAATAAVAAKPGPGSPTGTGSVFIDASGTVSDQASMSGSYHLSGITFHAGA